MRASRLDTLWPGWRLLALPLLLAGVAVCVLGGLSSAGVARGATASTLQQQIGASQSRVNALSGAVQATGSKLASLNASISAYQARIAVVQRALDSKRAALAALTAKLGAARLELARLESLQARAQQALSAQLINSYETQPPDLVTVVLESSGFQDLLDRLNFQQRIRNEDVQIVSRVRAARQAVAAQAVRLGAL